MKIKFSRHAKRRVRLYKITESTILKILLGKELPPGTHEIIEKEEGVNLDTTSEDKIVGIEILNASKKMDLKTILSYTLEFEKDLITQRTT